MKKRQGSFLVFFGLLAAVGMAQAAGNPKAGEEKAAACFGCHGEKGISEVVTFPKLAGQYARYIAKQIVDFQNGTRTDETMAGMAATLTERQDMEDIAAYFASQPVMKAAPVVSPLADKGKELYHSESYNCVSCHGPDGKGKGPKVDVFPVIGGQHKDYLAKTLADFHTEARKNDSTGLMAPIGKKLQEQEIAALAEYLSGM